MFDWWIEILNERGLDMILRFELVKWLFKEDVYFSL